MRATRSNALKGLLLVILAAAPAAADVVRIEVQSRTDLLGGQAFGAAGPYEIRPVQLAIYLENVIVLGLVVAVVARASSEALTPETFCES